MIDEELIEIVAREGLGKSYEDQQRPTPEHDLVQLLLFFPPC